MALLYKSDPVRGARWKELFAQHAPDIEFRQWPDIGDPNEIRYLLAWTPPENIMACLPSLEVLFATSAGVDQFDFDALPPKLPVVRMLDPAIERGMIEYATFATLWLHRRMATMCASSARGKWQAHMLVPTEKRRIGILGLGQLGCAIATIWQVTVLTCVAGRVRQSRWRMFTATAARQRWMGSWLKAIL
ncbi:hypothetical protein HORIV_64140 [Vreelandella olivaria]|uniref:Glyoxylate/hydroxypyruvate reductase A n=1 Tax=Vreelandella olivaria TaxID=390919 RepID=A0ABM7GT14_9GAMM|nr:hypothetical protein HORIV_64140 [Halomonas olivaria]